MPFSSGQPLWELAWSGGLYVDLGCKCSIWGSTSPSFICCDRLSLPILEKSFVLIPQERACKKEKWFQLQREYQWICCGPFRPRSQCTGNWLFFRVDSKVSLDFVFSQAIMFLCDLFFKEKLSRMKAQSSNCVMIVYRHSQYRKVRVWLFAYASGTVQVKKDLKYRRLGLISCNYKQSFVYWQSSFVVKSIGEGVWWSDDPFFCPVPAVLFHPM